MEQEQRYEEDTIDLIDLLAVVWRYRIMIVVVTLLSVGAGWLYTAVSRTGEGEPNSVYRVQTVLFFEPFVQTVVQGDRAPTVVRSYSDVASRILEALSNPASLRAIAEASEPNAPEPDDAVVSALERLTLEPAENNPYIVTLTIVHSESSVATEATNRALSLLQARLASLGLQHPEGDRPIYYLLEPPTPPVRTEESDNRNPATVVTIAGVTGFFLAIFLSFVLSYISRVRQDPEAMAKLKDASRRK